MQRLGYALFLVFIATAALGPVDVTSEEAEANLIC